jgi:2-methylcitrate dehydratase PrpD
MTGPSSIPGGTHGFYAVYASDPEAPTRLRNHLATLGERWHLREAALKARDSRHYIQPFLEGLETLLNRGLHAGNITSIHCAVPPGEESLNCEPWAEKLRPSSAYQVFNLPYALGVVLADGVVTIATFEAPARPEDCACAARVRSPIADGDFPNRYGARHTVTTSPTRSSSWRSTTFVARPVAGWVKLLDRGQSRDGHGTHRRKLD